ncbi:MAG: hypothetical protein IPI46_05045 [Bacteroidetes bacterium]|nr:hypothetical protein [Bacteroidota bacterium]
MLKYPLLLCFILFTSWKSEAEDSLQLIKSIPIQGLLISTDPLGNVYIVKENNSVYRINSKGDSTGIFNEIKKGKITQIDASNPLRVLLYYADYNQIVVLNNMMTQKNVIKLNSIGLNNIACIANSADGSIWLYDAVNGNLLKIDEQLNILLNVNLRSIQENPLAPTAMFESERSLYITDTLDGIRKFDLFGFYNTSYHFKSRDVQLIQNYFVYRVDSNLVSYNMNTLNERILQLPDSKTIKQVRIERDMVYILRETSLDLYSIMATIERESTDYK